MIERGGYQPEKVFNADKTGFYQKRMSQKTYISNYEKSASRYKVSKEVLTLLPANNLGFEDLGKGDLLDFLDDGKESLSKEELIQLETERALDALCL
ncbi:hypothetical protein TNCV_2982931 [Trichonephila clavipes]|nr:hypothetical protein TNCV_2982931 [Trichonephila clavipes]